MIEIKPYRKQKSWLTQELLHSAPKGLFCRVVGKPGVQLEHPGGGPLAWVQCPHSYVMGVERVDGKWYWTF